MSDDRNPSPSGETWACRANPAVYGVCTSPVGAIPGHNGCGPVPSSDTPSDGAGCPSKDCTRGECIDCPPPTPIDGDSGRRMETLLSRFAWLADSARSEGFHEAAAAYTVCRDELSDALTPAPSSDTPSDERRPVDGGERSQSEQWFVVHHNQIRSLRFGTFPIERLARASIAACTCGPHTLRHTVTTTYTASTTEEFVAAAADRGEG